jgi:hypothetical protein
MMAKTVIVPVDYPTSDDDSKLFALSSYNKYGKVSVNFPDCCVYCCEKAATYRDVEVEEKFFKDHSTGYTIEKTYKMELQVPYCAKHDKDIQKIKKFNGHLQGWITLLGVVFAIANLISRLRAGEFEDLAGFYKYIMLPMPFIILGLLLGTLCYLIIRVALRPVLAIFIKSSIHIPFTIGEKDKNRVLGVKIKFTKQGDSIRFRFNNSSYAEKFAAKNPSAVLK